MIDELVLYERFEAFEQSDEEEQEVREYALRNELETWVPGGMDTVCCVKLGQEDYSIPNPPIVHSFSYVLGMLTHASFLNLRRPGWQEKDDLQALHNEKIVGLPEDEQRLLRGELEAQWGPITRVAREQQKAEYAKQAARLLNGDLIIDELATRVRELREQLEQEAELLRLWHGQSLSGWFQAAFVIQDGKGESPEEKPTAGRTRLDMLFSSVREGLPPARTLFKAERVFRDTLNTPEAVTKAQLAGLAYLLAEREPVLRHAAKVRDILTIYEPLLQCAVLNVPPLSPDALEALRKIREVETAEANLLGARTGWAPVLVDARANSDWGPLVQFLAKAMQEGPGASRAELAVQFGTVCDRYPKAKAYYEGKGLDPAAVNLDTLGRLRKMAVRFLEQMQANRLKSDR